MGSGAIPEVRMNTLEALLAGIVSAPLEETWWLVLADWLEEFDDPRRGELLRLHRNLIATCCDPEQNKSQRSRDLLARILFRRERYLSQRVKWRGRIVELLSEGVYPCVPQETLLLPNDVPMTFSFIPPGSFRMGSNHKDACQDEKPVRVEKLSKDFFMGIHPVTQRQWKAVMGTDPSHFKGPNRPVECVSWSDAQAFCNKLTTCLDGRITVRLPRDVEWEYACRAGTTTHYHFGDVINTSLANYNPTYSWNGSRKGKFREETTDVGSFPCNLWGLFDLHGNVSEWCEDLYPCYSPEHQPELYRHLREELDRNNQNSNECRVVHMGSWNDAPLNCRATARCTLGVAADYNGVPAAYNPECGFRVCFTATELHRSP
jgi:uncharacterized protein (TIGR02996 family)